MPTTLSPELKRREIEAVIASPPYEDLVDSLARNIRTITASAENEASVVSCFELELFSFLRENFDVRYYPRKERLVNTERHVQRGRIDSKIGALIIEYKHPSKLRLATDREKASSQIVEYLKGLNKEEPGDYLGLITDGRVAKFVRLVNDSVIEEGFAALSRYHLDRLIKSIVLLERIALTPENLVKSFCEPEGAAFTQDFVTLLFQTLRENPTERTIMLFNEWKELFRLAHDDKSKQRAIQERSAALQQAIGQKLKTNEEEYMVMYSLQTVYAIIVKVIGFRTLSTIWFEKSLIHFNKLAEETDLGLQIRMNSLEEGAIFRDLGVGNLLEGDFFSWYSEGGQWTSEIAEQVRRIFSKLTEFEDKAVLGDKDKVQDLFKDLYLRIMPAKVRHSLGEFYTPAWLADNLTTEAIALLDKKRGWRGLDPCAGSGTFLTVMIQKILTETAEQEDAQRLQQVIERVKGIDLNPLAVLTARINYFINISPLIRDAKEFEIPVYLGDASYVPEKVLIDDVPCLQYRVNTLKGALEIAVPEIAVRDLNRFSKAMTEVENHVRNLDSASIKAALLQLIPEKYQKEKVLLEIDNLAKELVGLEINGWNGIWARIVTNFLSVAAIGKFDIIVGNPPWIDWKNLPAGYRERIKSICISRELFSGDRITGGINLNICALIANVAAQNWLSTSGVLAFLMPKPLAFQQSYEGFRKLKLSDGRFLYFQKFFDWTKSGHPFDPVQQEFLTYFLGPKRKDYKKGIEVRFYIRNQGVNLTSLSRLAPFDEVASNFLVKKEFAGQCSSLNTTFTYAETRNELEEFEAIAGSSNYLGREGIEFYPQELFLLQPLDMPRRGNVLYLKNYQNHRSKYRVPIDTIVLERQFLRPLIKGVNINRFSISEPEFVVPFPYSPSSPRVPLDIAELQKQSPLLANYFKRFRSIIGAQTEYNERIIGRTDAEFYALARVGKYSFAKYHVVFRDNTKWQAAVVSADESWFGLNNPVFQNHAASISETVSGREISLDEAHYICAILNAPITQKFIHNSSDPRSFKIRPPVKIPEFDPQDRRHRKLAELSREAHATGSQNIADIDEELDHLYLQIVA